MAGMACSGKSQRDCWLEARLKGHVEEQWIRRLDRALSPKYGTAASFKMKLFKNDVKGIGNDA